MKADPFANLKTFESSVWRIADNLRASSNLASNVFHAHYGSPPLRHATDRFYEAHAAIEADEKAGKMPDRLLVETDFTRRCALNLPEGRPNSMQC